MTSYFLISVLLLLALAAALLIGSAGRGALWGSAMPNSTIMLPSNHYISGGGLGSRPPSPNFQTLGKNRFICCRSRRHSCAPSAGATMKAGSGIRLRRAR